MMQIPPPPPPDDHESRPLVAPTAEATPEKVRVCLGTVGNGYLQLTWEAVNPDSWDWVGLYASVSDPDASPQTWQYVSRGNSYNSSYSAVAGYQARYLRWDATSKAYRALVRTEPFPERVVADAYDLTGWMRYLTDENVPLSALTLPGTHDSAAWGMWLPVVNCQGISIAHQLRDGIRFLDIRLAVYKDSKSGESRLVCMHGVIDLRLAFTEVLKDIYVFLDKHPEEVVVMSVKNEAGTDRDVFAKLLMESVDMNRGRFLLGDDVPRLGAARGKIVILRRFSPAPTDSPIFGIDCSSNWTDNGKNITITYPSKSSPGTKMTVHVQDFYNTSDVNAKWEAVRGMLNQAKAGSSGDVYLNYTSAVGSYSPYNMAVSVNPMVRTLVTNEKPPARIGWVPMDWPEVTPRLVYDLVTRNSLKATVVAEDGGVLV
jgi:1-phosphatidylinositol phosphodiesterase